MVSRYIKTGIVSALLFLSINPAVAKALKPPYGVAQVDLGFSGAKLIIRSTPVSNDRGADHRVLTLITASGKRQELTLKDGGGHLGNSGINLYATKGDGFLLLSQKDCVRIDPLKPALLQCPPIPPCGPNLPDEAKFLGRFDWMNGFDPPRGDFVYRFRYIQFYDASCSA